MANYGNGVGRALRTAATHQAEKNRLRARYGPEVADRLTAEAGHRSLTRGITWRCALRDLESEELLRA